MKTRTLLLAAVLAVPFFAQAQTARMEQRELNQERRIQQGEASGSLTPREAARLERGQAHVDRMEARAAADGKVTRREQNRIEHAQDVQSRHINREKYDRQHDFNHDGRKDRPARRH